MGNIGVWATSSFEQKVIYYQDCVKVTDDYIEYMDDIFFASIFLFDGLDEYLNLNIDFDGIIITRDNIKNDIFRIIFR